MTSPPADKRRTERRARNAAIFGAVVAAVGIAVLISGEALMIAVLPAIALLCGLAGVWIWERSARRP